jgi:hypothetical protein
MKTQPVFSVLLLYFFTIQVIGAPSAITDSTTQPELAKYCNLYKGIAKDQAGKKATVAPVVAKSALVNGSCKVNLEAVLSKGETTTLSSTFSRETDESVFSNVITVSRPADPPTSPWTGVAIDATKGEIYSSSYQVSNKLATQCIYSIDNAPFIETPLVARNSFYSFCKIPLSGGGKHILYYAFVSSGIWGRVEGKKTGFAYTLPSCQ